MNENQTVMRIAKMIREIRLKRNLTVQQLAERTRVTKGMLSKIENGKTVSSLPVFIQILQSLDISMIDFFKEMTTKTEQNYWVIRKRQYKHMRSDGVSGISDFHILRKSIPSSTTEICLHTIKPGSKGHPIVGQGLKFKYMISGTCEYQLGTKVLTLNTGDSICFQATIPHHPVNKSTKEATLLSVMFQY